MSYIIFQYYDFDIIFYFIFKQKKNKVTPSGNHGKLFSQIMS